MLGVRKCGTQDISQWFKKRHDMILNKQGIRGWVKAGVRDFPKPEGLIYFSLSAKTLIRPPPTNEAMVHAPS